MMTNLFLIIIEKKKAANITLSEQFQKNRRKTGKFEIRNKHAII